VTIPPFSQHSLAISERLCCENDQYGRAVDRARTTIRAFNIGFGAIDLYQALASRLHWWPEGLFRWTKVDDLLHVVIGVMLMAVGLFL
jgi:hypothetical protein